MRFFDFFRKKDKQTPSTNTNAQQSTVSQEPIFANENIEFNIDESAKNLHKDIQEFLATQPNENKQELTIIILKELQGLQFVTAGDPNAAAYAKVMVDLAGDDLALQQMNARLTQGLESPIHVDQATVLNHVFPKLYNLLGPSTDIRSSFSSHSSDDDFYRPTQDSPENENTIRPGKIK